MYCRQCGHKVEDTAKFCPKCGTQIADDADQEKPLSTDVQKNDVPEAAFQQTRLIISIITLAFTFFILFQSCAAGLSNRLEGSAEIGGTAGLVLCICWWVAGILTITKRKDYRYTKNAMVAYGIASVTGLLFAGSFSDLRVYGFLSIAFAVICYLAAKPRGPQRSGN